MRYLYNSLTFTTLFSIFTLIVLVIYNGLNSNKIKFFLTLLINSFLWVLLFLIQCLSTNTDKAFLIAKLMYIPLSLLPTFILYLAMHICSFEIKRVRQYFKILLLMPSFFFIYAVFSNKIFTGIYKSTFHYNLIFTSYNIFFLLYSFLFEIIAIALLIYFAIKRRKNAFKRNEFIFIIFGFLLPGFIVALRYIYELLNYRQVFPYEIWFFIFSSLCFYYGLSRYGIITGDLFNKKILNSSMLYIAGINLNNEIFEINDSFLKAIELKQKDVIGENVNKVRSKIKNKFSGFEKATAFLEDLNSRQEYSNLENKKIITVKNIKRDKNLNLEIHLNPIFVEKHLFGHIFVMYDITEKINAEKQLTKKHKLLEAVVKSIDKLLSSKNLEEGMTSALEVIGRETRVDRVYVFENSKNEQNKTISTQKFEWTASKISSQMDNKDLKGFPIEVWFPKMYSTLLQNSEFGGLIENFPEKQRQHFEKQNILSLILVPIFVDNLFWGFIGLDECRERRNWDKDEILALKAAAGLIGDAVTHRVMEEKIKELAYYDIVTGLPNRVLLYDRLKMAIENAKRYKKVFAVFLMDFDRFKNVNDAFGHSVGDKLLKIFAKRVSSLIRKIDTLARFGGDEFVFIIQQFENIEDIRKIADKVIKCFEKTFTISGHQLKIRASMGIAVYPENGFEIEDLIKNADIAMYKAKNNGGNQFVFYSDISNF